MKKKILIVVLPAMMLLVYTCKSSDEKEADVDPLTGQWRIENIKSSTKNNAIGFLVFAFMRNDSVEVDYEFRRDSVLFYGNG